MKYFDFCLTWDPILGVILVAMIWLALFGLHLESVCGGVNWPGAFCLGDAQGGDTAEATQSKQVKQMYYDHMFYTLLWAPHVVETGPRNPKRVPWGHQKRLKSVSAACQNCTENQLETLLKSFWNSPRMLWGIPNVVQMTPRGVQNGSHRLWWAPGKCVKGVLRNVWKQICFNTLLTRF